MTFTDEHRIAADYMLGEMREQKLSVGTAPDQHGQPHRKIRVVTQVNPWWYSELCQANLNRRQNPKWRRPRTIIKRCQIVEALVKVRDSVPLNGKHGEYVRIAIVRYLEVNGEQMKPTTDAAESDPFWSASVETAVCA